MDGELLVSSSFFFQAEDGIRGLVRSRGLGDVYKRQPPIPSSILINEQIADDTPDEDEDENEEMIEVIDEPTNQINDDEDIPSKEDETDEHFYEDLADMDYDENEDERPIDDDLLI